MIVNGTNEVGITGAEAGNAFTVTYLLDGKTATVKLTITAE